MLCPPRLGKLLFTSSKAKSVSTWQLNAFPRFTTTARGTKSKLFSVALQTSSSFILVPVVYSSSTADATGSKRPFTSCLPHPTYTAKPVQLQSPPPGFLRVTTLEVTSNSWLYLACTSQMVILLSTYPRTMSVLVS